MIEVVIISGRSIISSDDAGELAQNFSKSLFRALENRFDLRSIECISSHVLFLGSILFSVEN